MRELPLLFPLYFSFTPFLSHHSTHESVINIRSVLKTARFLRGTFFFCDYCRNAVQSEAALSFLKDHSNEPEEKLIENCAVGQIFRTKLAKNYGRRPPRLEAELSCLSLRIDRMGYCSVKLAYLKNL